MGHFPFGAYRWDSWSKPSWNFLAAHNHLPPNRGEALWNWVQQHGSEKERTDSHFTVLKMSPFPGKKYTSRYHGELSHIGLGKKRRLWRVRGSHRVERSRKFRRSYEGRVKPAGIQRPRGHLSWDTSRNSARGFISGRKSLWG